MEPGNISSLILSFVIGLILVIYFFYLRLVGDFSKKVSLRSIKRATFGGIKRSGYPDAKRTPPIKELLRAYKVQYFIADIYFASALFMVIYGILGGRADSKLYLLFYFYTALLGYSVVYLEYKVLIVKYWGLLRFLAAATFSCSVLAAGILVDQNIQLITSLPAEFFPTSQTALLIVFLPLLLLVVFNILSLFLYAVNILVVLGNSAGRKRISMSKVIFNGELVLIFMLLSVGTVSTYNALIGIGYNQFYEDSFVEYSYNLNGNTCGNIGRDLYISHLKTGGVSVAYKKTSGKYCFSVATCDRSPKKYPKSMKYQERRECD